MRLLFCELEGLHILNDRIRTGHPHRQAQKLSAPNTIKNYIFYGFHIRWVEQGLFGPDSNRQHNAEIDVDIIIFA